jgi:hypothetical protein
MVSLWQLCWEGDNLVPIVNSSAALVTADHGRLDGRSDTNGLVGRWEVPEKGYVINAVESSLQEIEVFRAGDGYPDSHTFYEPLFFDENHIISGAAGDHHVVVEGRLCAPPWLPVGGDEPEPTPEIMTVVTREEYTPPEWYIFLGTVFAAVFILMGFSLCAFLIWFFAVRD